ncbi:MAG: hypothetical protein LBC63_09790 [Holophagales bacterium]|jgi:hypothetical protein|nr:hypothetical protein [Holophagales bacterium]
MTKIIERDGAALRLTWLRKVGQELLAELEADAEGYGLFPESTTRLEAAAEYAGRARSCLACAMQQDTTDPIPHWLRWRSMDVACRDYEIYCALMLITDGEYEELMALASEKLDRRRERKQRSGRRHPPCNVNVAELLTRARAQLRTTSE